MRYDVLTQSKQGGEFFVPIPTTADTPEDAARNRVAKLGHPLDYASVAVVEYDFDGMSARYVHIFNIEEYVPEPAPEFVLVPR